MMFRHFKLAFRHLRRDQFSTFINTAGLAVAIAMPLAYFFMEKWLLPIAIGKVGSLRNQ